MNETNSGLPLRLLSVVIPCLNRVQYLKPTLESILGQDYPSIECIVVDGGSTDGTLELLRRYEGRIRWISEPDQGHADAINKGWRMANGTVLAWLNADDVWEIPNAAQLAMKYLEEHPDVDVVYGDCGRIDPEGRSIGMSYLHEWDLEYAVEYSDHCIPQPAAFIRRSILDKAGYLDTSIFTKDRELWLRIGLAGKIQHLPVLLAHARSLPGLSQNGRLVAAGCVQTMRRFFTLPGVPERLRRKRSRAISNAYLRGMEYAWNGGRHWPLLWVYALRAMLSDPTNCRAALGRLKDFAQLDAPDSAALRGLLLLGALLNLPRSLWREWGAIRALRRARKINLAGDRDVEWSWVAAEMPQGPGEALDFGCGTGALGLLAAQRGFRVTALDLQQIQWSYTHPGLRFQVGDLLRCEFPAERLDLVINCSAVEHVGLSGRYGVSEERADGDLEAMRRLNGLLKSGGVMLLTIPMGRDALFAPLCRVYGKIRLPRLLEGFRVEKETFWVKDAQNRWVLESKECAQDFQASAGSWNPLENSYALGCFVLRKD